MYKIEANNAEEVVGNVSFFVEVAAFNSNYTYYRTLPYASQQKSWRWRRHTYGFNLSIFLPESN